MKILVTGGAGFIGSNLVKRLLDQGHTVLNIDDLSTGSLEFLQDILMHPRHRFIHGSILNRPLLDSLFDEQVDCVFHLAAVLGVKNTVEDPLKVIEGNIDGTRIVLELAYRNGSKVVFASTSEVYGKNKSLPFHENSDRVLGSSSTHRWCYATAKSLDEHMCFGYAQKGLQVTVIRYFNTYGPAQTNSQYGMVIPRFINAALNGEPLCVYGAGTQTRCFTFIDDAVQGTVNAMRPEANGFAFNIGWNIPISIHELAVKIKRMTGSPSEIRFVPYEEAYGAGYEDMPARIPDMSLSRDILGFEPKVPLEEGLQRTIAWYRNQRAGVGK